MLKLYLIFLVIMSTVAFLMYLSDKLKARHGKWRIKESLLLSTGFLGGALGALLGMKLFRHKTRHLYFWVVNVIGLLLQVAILIWLVIRT